MKNIKVGTSGRHGKIQYVEGWLKKNTCEFYWEFGGGDTVAMVWVPSRSGVGCAVSMGKRKET